ncbi:MAG TPA: hypothetical protein VJ846_09355 [Sphingomicrobium sp.]|nr:hypothetical protein [Sphingomicrobium sp.]
MPSSKQVRANTIVLDFLERDRQRPTIDPRSELPARMVGEPSGLWARITFDHRFNVAPVYGARTARRPIRDKGWMAVTIYNRDMEVLSVNVRGSYFHIAFYKPGPWEGVFGVDWGGDHVIHQWGDPPIGDDLEEQLALRDKDLQLDPTRGHPPVVDELRASVRQNHRARDRQFDPAGPLTVSLRQKGHRLLSS